MHVVPLQVPDVQMPPEQHGSPVNPHWAHCGVPPEAEHTTPEPVHALPGQQGSPSLPHDSQKPPLLGQICWLPTDPHVPPTPTHLDGVDELSQQPFVQLLALQHGSPALPHDWHCVPEHTLEPPEQDSPLKTHALVVGSQQPLWHATPVLQHGEPEVPQDSQYPFVVQTSWKVPLDAHVPPVATQTDEVADVLQQPAVQRSPTQQGCPAAPHAWHVVPEQTLDPEQVPPWYTQRFVEESQQPLWHAAPVVQQLDPV
jgi:hypothetical protein